MEQVRRPVPIRPAAADGGRAMRAEVLARVGLTPFGVWVWLADEAAGGEARVSYNEAAEVLGVSRSTVLRAVKALVGAGFLEVLPPATPGRNGVNRYRVIGVTNGVTNGVTAPLQVVPIGVTNGVTNGVTAPPHPPVTCSPSVTEQSSGTNNAPPPPSPAPSWGRKAADYPPGFLAAWQAYPHHGTRSDKRRSLPLWQAAVAADGEAAVLAAIGAWRESADWTKDDGQYVPGMQVWLAREGWRMRPKRTTGRPYGPEPGSTGFAPKTVPIPEGWQPKDSEVLWAKAQGLSNEQVRVLTDEFIANAKLSGSTAINWDDKWRTRIKNLLLSGLAQ